MDFIVKQRAKKAAKQKELAEKKNIEKLKEYKKLLDDGLITQEEYDKKKQQLLNL